MLRYLLKRLFFMIPMVFGITLISFAVIHLVPGEPGMLEAEMNPKVTKEARERIRAFYGLDKPLHVQYWTWLKRIVRFDFGTSYASDAEGDVYLTGRLPVEAIDAPTIDRLLGTVLTACDEPFNELLTMGFLSSMRREWAWRTSRGESTRNLEAFRHLLEDDPQSSTGATSDGS